MAQKGKRQDWDGDDTHCICIRIHHACMSEGGTVIALPLLTEYMTQALYRHMSRVFMEFPLLFITFKVLFLDIYSLTH